MNKLEEIFEKHYVRLMYQKDYLYFKRYYPTLTRVVLAALEEVSKLTEPIKPTKRLYEINPIHFHIIFSNTGTIWGSDYVRRNVKEFVSMQKFYLAISNIGDFTSYEKAKNLGYDVTYSLDLGPTLIEEK